MPDYNLLNKQIKKLKKKFYNEENFESFSDSYYDKVFSENSLNSSKSIQKVHLIILLKEMIGLILSCFEPVICKNDEEKLDMINFLRIMHNHDSSILQDILNDNIIRLYFFAKGNENLIRSAFIKNNILEKNLSAYIDICKIIAIEQIELITNTVFNSLSESSKKNYLQYQSEYNRSSIKHTQ